MLDRQRHDLEESAEVEQYDPQQQSAISLMAGNKIRRVLEGH